MADSTSVIDLISSSQAQKEVTANNALNAASQAMYGSRRATTTAALTWGFYGGRWKGTAVANGTLTLTASTTNYIVLDKATGAITSSTATTNWNNRSRFFRLYSVVTGSASITSFQDHRQVYDQEPHFPINYQTVGSPSSYTIVEADLGRTVELDNSLGVDVILPNNLPEGFNCRVVQLGSGQVTFVAAVGANVYNRQSHTKTAGQFAVTNLYITKNAASPTMINAEWILSGDTAA